MQPWRTRISCTQQSLSGCAHSMFLRDCDEQALVTMAACARTGDPVQHLISILCMPQSEGYKTKHMAQSVTRDQSNAV